jgi:hypothetical protein
MKEDLHQKIEQRKHAIDEKKQHLSHDYQVAKRRLTSATGLSLTTLGGIAIGFLLFPRKYRLLKSFFKAYSMAATLKGFLEFVPHQERRRTHRHRASRVD